MKSESAGANGIVSGWIITRQPDGTLLMRETAETRKQASTGCLLFTVIWNAMVLFFLSQTFGLLPGNWDAEGSSPRSAVLGGLALFGIIGLYGIFSVISTRLSYQEWIAGPSYIELRWGWEFSRKAKTRRYFDGTLTVEHMTDSQDGPSTALFFQCPGGWMNQGALVGTRGTEVTPAQVGELAELVAQTTGWELTVKGTPPDEDKPG